MAKRKKIMKTEQKQITATPNFSKRTFTIRVFVGNFYKSKYRTTKMTKQEFEEANYYTFTDWQHFLRSDNYYRIY